MTQRLIPIQITPPSPRWRDALRAAAQAEGVRPSFWIMSTLTKALVSGGFFKPRVDSAI